MTHRSFNFLVSGKVQGVSFRAFAKGIAHDTGVVGWIANDTRGNVIGTAQGHQSALDRFKKALHTGPPHARVQSVLVEDERELDALEYDVFEVRR
ncbi:Acylphosphatase-like domain-containing protein [Amylocystis lapponica]|nr:Acylphosphatase-like domain-containing protein [Amylocystis lapponica]